MGNFFKDIGDKLESAWDKVEAQVDRSYDDFREFQYKAIPYLQTASGVLGPFIPGLSQGVDIHSNIWGKSEGGHMPDQVLYIDPRYNQGGMPLGVGGLPPGTGGYGVGGDWTQDPPLFTAPWVEKYKTALLIGGGILLVYLIK